MTMGDRIKTRQQQLDEQTKAAKARVIADDPSGDPQESPRPDRPTTH